MDSTTREVIRWVTIGIPLVLIVTYLLLRGWRRSRTFKLVMAGAIVVVWVIGVKILEYNPDPDSVHAHMGDYTTELERRLTVPLEGDSGYIRGKLILVRKLAHDTIAGDIAGLLGGVIITNERDKPNGLLLAQQHDEVQTVVWLECPKIAVGRYSIVAKAYRVDCILTVIDFETGAVVARQKFRGGDPPEVKVGAWSDATGELPSVGQMYEYLKGLERR